MNAYTKVLVGIVIVAIIACLLSYALAKMRPFKQLKNDEFYNRVLGTLNSWILCETIWTAIHIVLSIMPFICSLMILHIECYNTKLRDTIVLLSILSLSLMSVSYFLKPNVQAQMFRNAYETLKPAVIEYESWFETKAGKSTKAMQDALKAGEKIIGTAIK